MNKRVTPTELEAFFDRDHLDVWGSPDSVPLQSIELPDPCVDELVSAAGKVNESNFQQIQLGDLPSCAKVVDEIRDGLFSKSGCVLVDRFPVESFETPINRLVSGIFANLISPLMAQDIKGTLLYDVLDVGAQESSNNTRRSKTNQAQPFHTDGPWLSPPPSLIGLFCIQPAESGGLSQVSSLQHAFYSISAQSSDAFDHYFEDMHWNRMGQHKSDEAAYETLPFLETPDGCVLMRHYADYVRTGYKLAGSEIPDSVDAFLSSLDHALIKNACEPFCLESGQFQFVNNWTVAHARSGFEGAGSESGRHLIRLWNHRVPSVVGV